MKIFLIAFLIFNINSYCQTNIDKKSGFITVDEMEVNGDSTQEVMPFFPGGQDSLLKYIRNNLVLNDSSLNCDHRTIYTMFTIDSVGNISDVKIMRGCDSRVDNQIKLALASMPKWKPGRRNGKSVNASYILPINIKWQ